MTHEQTRVLVMNHRTPLTGNNGIVSRLIDVTESKVNLGLRCHVNDATKGNDEIFRIWAAVYGQCASECPEEV